MCWRVFSSASSPTLSPASSSYGEFWTRFRRLWHHRRANEPCRDDNIQSHLSNYISDQLLNSNEFTVWDEPWPQHEDQRGSCCSTAPDRLEQGRLRQPGEELKKRVERNPIKQMEAKGQGIFEMEWQERAKLLRQLVDWQRKSTRWKSVR